jgi:1,5-anhydro-D-fructose reductase (1,5-anhydro-D-mannitol-forming)
LELGWGIVSTAAVADGAVAPALARIEGARLVGVVGRDRDRTNAFAARHSIPFSTTRYDQLLALPGLDAVYIASPNALHRQHVEAAAAAGKHVLCEKPLATTVADAEAAVAACRDAGVKLGQMFQTRHHPVYGELAAVIGRGELGDLLLVECQVSPGNHELSGWRTDPSLAGHGTIFNLGVHAYDLVRWLVGSEVVDVTALLDVGREAQLERLALALLRFANGTLAYVNANQVMERRRPDLTVYGSDGRIDGHGITRQYSADGEARIVTAAGERVVPAPAVDLFERAVAAFQRAVLAGEEPPANGEDGLRSVAIATAVARSAREGRVVELARVASEP